MGDSPFRPSNSFAWFDGRHINLGILAKMSGSNNPSWFTVVLKHCKVTLMDIPARVIAKILFITTLFVGSLWFIYATRTIMLWLITAFVLALALNPVVAWLQTRLPRMRRGAAIGIVFVVITILVGGFLYSLVPPLVQESRQLIQHYPEYSDEFFSSSAGKFLQKYHIVEHAKANSNDLGNLASRASGSAINILSRVFSSFIAGVTIFVLTIFMLMVGPRWVEAFFSALPNRHRERGRSIGHDMYKAVTGFMTGKLIMSILAAIPTYILLLILGVPYALSLAVIVGIFDLIPLVGATIGAVVVVLVSLFTSVTAALVMVVFFLVFQNIENHITQPVIMRHSVQLTSLTVLVAALIGAELGGILGALLAIPAVACLWILLRDLFKIKLPS
jgi:predicted PurR-regulated permease PerM